MIKDVVIHKLRSVRLATLWVVGRGFVQRAVLAIGFFYLDIGLESH